MSQFYISLLRTVALSLTLILLLSAAGIGGPNPHETTPILTAIEQDYAAGVINADERALLTIRTIKARHQLPSRYLALEPDTPVRLQCATPQILEIRNQWNSLLPETQAEISSMMTRHAAVLSYNSPSGFFKLHYDTLGTHAVPSADGNANNVPDYIEKCAAYMDTSLTAHTSRGYLSPPSDFPLGGDAKFDVYFEEMGAYGYAVSEADGPEPWNDASSHLVLHRDFVGFPPNDDPEGDIPGAAKATAVHEYHHCVQFAYDPDELIWFMESGATWMEDIGFNLVDDNYNYLGSFMSNPETSLMSTSIHMYASFIWQMFLTEQFDTSLVRAVWEGARTTTTDVFEAMTDSLLGRYGWTPDSAFAQFALWNFFTGSRDDGAHYDEGPFYPLMAIDRTHSSYPVTTISSPVNPSGYAACYVQLLPGSLTGGIKINFDGVDTRQWAAWVIKRTDGGVNSVQQIPLSSSNWTGNLTIPNFDGYQYVTLVGVNISEFASSASFSYSVSLASVYNVASSMAADSVIYSGDTRELPLVAHNLAPLSDVIRIRWSDSNGWMTLDSVDVFVPAMDSAITSMTMSCPVSTPLGATTSISLFSRSMTDQSVTSSATGHALVVLQRGDLDFDGSVDISDLTILISYLFLEGPPPVPVVEAGDFDCLDDIDISDLTKLIENLFITLAPCPCNPY